MRWAKANPEKRKAHCAVTNALRAKTLVRKPCESCGKKKAQAHHDDYSKVLEVRWLCTRCHGLEHRARNEAERAQA
jgi:ribosomal protein S27AE